jgi:phosphatidylglycerophosphate synthase
VPNEEETKVDCYSAGERKWMQLGQQIRASLLSPLLQVLSRFGVSPDQVTLVSLACGMLFVPLWLNGFAWYALLFLLLHVLLDGLDGPLARYQKADGQRGSFTDSFCDQIIVSVVSIALMSGSEPLIDVWGGSLFVLLYVGVLAMSMVRNALNVPYSWLVRPRFFFYAAIPFELLGTTNIVTCVTWISNFLLALKAISGFFKLRHRLPN